MHLTLRRRCRYHSQVFCDRPKQALHWAIHGHTAAELIAERADARKPNMGLTSWRGEKIKKANVTIANNYLKRDELEMLNLLVDQYLSFAELQARQRKPMYMKDWERKLNEFLKLNERDILNHLGKISARLSEEIAGREFEKYWAGQQADIAGIPDLEKSVKKLRDPRKKGYED